MPYEYLVKSSPVPAEKRTPWFLSIAPSYAGIFLWVVFYRNIASGTTSQASLGICLAALLVAAVLCYILYYRVPAMLGMTTGRPLYVLGSSTFGTAGGYLMPGILMGLLQIGWFAVATSISTEFILKGLHLGAEAMTTQYIVVGLIWGLVFAFIAAMGIHYIARVALLLNAIPLLMIIVVFFQTLGGASSYHGPTGPVSDFGGVTVMISMVVGFFATAGAAGADFAMNVRSEKDVRWGGIVGVAIAGFIAGALPLASVTFAHAANPAVGFDYANVLQSIGGPIATAMFFLFAVASIPATCFCIFIAGNSLSTMIPTVPRVTATMGAAVVGIILAVTGVAANLTSFFTIVGASFGPIVGAMAADYVLSGRKWAGPRQGINLAGYLAWASGFVVGILPFLPLSDSVKTYIQPAGVYSFIVGFLVYAVLAKAGMQPAQVSLTELQANGDAVKLGAQ